MDLAREAARRFDQFLHFGRKEEITLRRACSRRGYRARPRSTECHSRHTSAGPDTLDQVGARWVNEARL